MNSIKSAVREQERGPAARERKKNDIMLNGIDESKRLFYQ